MDGAAFHLGNLGGEEEANALFLIVLLQQGHQVLVVFPGDVVQHLDDGHLHPDGVEVGRHLQADDPAADHRQAAGGFPQIQDLPVGHHKAPLQPFLQAGNGGYCRVGAGGDKQPLAHIGFPRRFHGVALRGAAGDLAEGLLHLHVVGLQGRLDPGHQGAHHLVLALDHLGVVDGQAAGGDPVFFPMLHAVVELGAIQQGLGGHAALV